MDNKLKPLIESVDKLLKFFSEKQSEKFEAINEVDSDSKVEYTALKIGADVSVSTASGSEVAPDGQYNLANGVAFTVKDGKIESIVSEGDQPVEEKPAEEIADAPADATEAPADVQPEEDEAVKALEVKVAAIEETINKLMEQMSAIPTKEDVASLKNELSSAYSAIESLSKIPTQLAADARVEIKDSADDAIKRVASLFNK